MIYKKLPTHHHKNRNGPPNQTFIKIRNLPSITLNGIGHKTRSTYMKHHNSKNSQNSQNIWIKNSIVLQQTVIWDIFRLMAFYPSASSVNFQERNSLSYTKRHTKEKRRESFGLHAGRVTTTLQYTSTKRPTPEWAWAFVLFCIAFRSGDFPALNKRRISNLKRSALFKTNKSLNRTNT